MIMLFEGPDRCGKTTIAKAVSKATRIPYYKSSGERKAFASRDNGADWFKNTLIYSGQYFADYLEQVNPHLIIDRGYPSERVYSKFFGRETIEDVHKRLDAAYNRCNVRIIVCRRKSYKGIKDDIRPDIINSESLERLDALYDEFTRWTTCPVHTLWVDDRDLLRQTTEVIEFAWGVKAL